MTGARSDAPSAWKILRRPTIPWLVLSSSVGRLPVNMTNLALILTLSARESVGFAASAAACFGVAFALTAAVKGRLLDHLGPRTVIVPASVIAAASLVVVALDANKATQIAAALVAGGTLPPVAQATRSALTRQFADDADMVHAAMSLDAVVSELSIVTGSALVALMALVLPKQGALLVTSAFIVLGGLAFSSTQQTRAWRARPNVRTKWSLANGQLLLLALQIALVSAGIGAVIVTLSAIGVKIGSPDVGGWLVTTTALSSVVSSIGVGLIKHARSSPIRAWIQLTLFSGLFAVLLTPLLIGKHVLLLFVIVFVAYLAVAPIYVAQSQLLAALAVSGQENETFSISPAANWIGQSTGVFLTGILAETHTLPQAALPCILIILAAIAATVGIAASRSKALVGEPDDSAS